MAHDTKPASDAPKFVQPGFSIYRRGRSRSTKPAETSSERDKSSSTTSLLAGSLVLSVAATVGLGIALALVGTPRTRGQKVSTLLLALAAPVVILVSQSDDEPTAPTNPSTCSPSGILSSVASIASRWRDMAEHTLSRSQSIPEGDKEIALVQQQDQPVSTNVEMSRSSEAVTSAILTSISSSTSDHHASPSPPTPRVASAALSPAPEPAQELAQSEPEAEPEWICDEFGMYHRPADYAALKADDPLKIWANSEPVKRDPKPVCLEGSRWAPGGDLAAAEEKKQKVLQAKDGANLQCSQPRRQPRQHWAQDSTPGRHHSQGTVKPRTGFKENQSHSSGFQNGPSSNRYPRQQQGSINRFNGSNNDRPFQDWNRNTSPGYYASDGQNRNSFNLSGARRPYPDQQSSDPFVPPPRCW